MTTHPSQTTHDNGDGRRTVIAFATTTVISVVVLALLAIFDVK